MTPVDNPVFKNLLYSWVTRYFEACIRLGFRPELATSFLAHQKKQVGFDVMSFNSEVKVTWREGTKYSFKSSDFEFSPEIVAEDHHQKGERLKEAVASLKKVADDFRWAERRLGDEQNSYLEFVASHFGGQDGIPPEYMPKNI